MPVMRRRNYVGGDLVAAVDDDWMLSREPATGAELCEVPASNSRDVDAAVGSACAAFPAWANLAAATRAAYLFRLADLIDRDAERLARAESDDTGKPLLLARSLDIPRAAANLRFFASISQGFHGESYAMPDALNYTLRSPLGAVACISPWNLPLYLLTWKIAPALAVGNCVIAKPSELTPLTASLLGELCVEAQLPPGVLNIIQGTGTQAGEALVQHPKIKAVSFTGGTKTGTRIAGITAPLLRKVSLELGGKNPTIVFGDCEFEPTLEASLQAAFRNQGQICLCGSRIFVERSLYPRFAEEFVARARRLIVGDPLEPKSDLGAVISPAHLAKIAGFAEEARDDGGRIECGGAPIAIPGRCAGGSFFPPTVVTGMTYLCHLNQAEVFGPLVSLIPFDDEQELLDAANGTPYGLSASVWTGDLKRAHRLAERLEAGVVWVNCWMKRDLRTPFGGVKQSGIGREGGEETLRFFTELKNVCVAT